MAKNKNSLLWEISSKKLKTPSYLFGTMHVKDFKVFGLLDVLQEKIDLCEAFAIEFNLDEMEYNLDENAILLQDGKTISTLLTPKLYTKLEKLFFKITNQDLAEFDNYLPIMIINLISEQLMSSDMPYSLDETLWRYARERNKVTLGIETYIEQLEILKRIKVKEQLKNLTWMVKNFKSHKKQIGKLTQYYEQSDLVSLNKLARKSAKGMRKILIYNRNTLMADRIENIIKEQSLFCAIGAGHLAGEKGVLRLLKMKGYKLRPIQNK